MRTRQWLLVLTAVVSFGCIGCKAATPKQTEEQKADQAREADFQKRFQDASEYLERVNVKAIAGGQVVVPIERVCELRTSDLIVLETFSPDRFAREVGSHPEFGYYNHAVARTLLHAVDTPVNERAKLASPERGCYLSSFRVGLDPKPSKGMFGLKEYISLYDWTRSQDLVKAAFLIYPERAELLKDLGWTHDQLNAKLLHDMRFQLARLRERTHGAEAEEAYRDMLQLIRDTSDLGFSIEDLGVTSQDQGRVALQDILDRHPGRRTDKR